MKLAHKTIVKTTFFINKLTIMPEPFPPNSVLTAYRLGRVTNPLRQHLIRISPVFAKTKINIL